MLRLYVFIMNFASICFAFFSPPIAILRQDGAPTNRVAIIRNPGQPGHMLLPLLVSTPPTPLPATSVVHPRVPSVMASEVVYGAVNAPGWVMPVAAACAGLIPVSFLAIAKGAGAPAGGALAGRAL